MIEFCWRAIGKPEQIGYHDYYRHYHIRYDLETGRREFRESVNRIFRRNGLAYELSELGAIERLAPPVFRHALTSALFATSDTELNRMLETARRKFIDPDEFVRRESFESLWDAWERFKTLDASSSKKAGVTALLDTVAGSSSTRFREALEREDRVRRFLAALKAVLLPTLRFRQNRGIDFPRSQDVPDGPDILAHHVKEGGTRILDKMPTTGDLDGLRRALGRGFDIAGAAVPGDKFNIRMVPKPCGGGVALAVWKKRHNTTLLQIAYNRSVSTSSAPRPVINSNRPKRPSRASGMATDGP